MHRACDADAMVPRRACGHARCIARHRLATRHGCESDAKSTLSSDFGTFLRARRAFFIMLS
jgi:hypothetical protein